MTSLKAVPNSVKALEGAPNTMRALEGASNSMKTLKRAKHNESLGGSPQSYKNLRGSC